MTVDDVIMPLATMTESDISSTWYHQGIYVLLALVSYPVQSAFELGATQLAS